MYYFILYRLGYNGSFGENDSGHSGVAAEDLTDTDPSLLVPQTVMIKEEVGEVSIVNILKYS